MPTGQVYQDGVPQAVLAAPGINGAVTTIPANASLASWPGTFPFTVAIDGGTSSMELVDVGGISGNNFTLCTRGVSGTSAQSHSTGALVTHVGSARDLREMRAHIDASASNDSQGHAVHGLAGSSAVVGTTDTQTLTNKTLTSPTLSGSPVVSNGSALTIDNTLVNPIQGPVGITYNSGNAFGGSGFSLGNGTQTAKYIQYGRITLFQAQLNIGSTTNLGTGMTLTIPKATSAAVNFHGEYTAASGTNDGPIKALVANGATSGNLKIFITGAGGGANLTPATLANTWGPATGDVISVQGVYIATT